jgi:hypothetical protein
MYTCIYIYIYMQTQVKKYKNTSKYKSTYAPPYDKAAEISSLVGEEKSYIHMCISVYMYVHLYVYTSIYIHICKYK